MRKINSDKQDRAENNKQSIYRHSDAASARPLAFPHEQATWRRNNSSRRHGHLMRQRGAISLLWPGGGAMAGALADLDWRLLMDLRRGQGRTGLV